MSYTDQQLAELKAFLDANSGTYGALSDEEAANTLNTLGPTRIRPSITGSEAWSVTVDSEFAALTAEQKEQWLGLCAIDAHDPGDGTPSYDLALRLFTATGPGTTRQRLADLRTETITVAAGQGWPSAASEDVRKARLL